ncbi:hypothetical protein K4A83_05340 [Spirulina subsalsa FACHB-351]|uniref:Uncharacterized protein n=1 Tax=Spirulina subsalsa FACHB-351 TaxID=234711 RepID=A0ABT3L2H5_9CYAN|nr:hypothetical protein [Spirulina subsalsa]MCW6035696.1 hypothetical protein [Spirulina subsalsa FACHB-351]
MSLDIAFYGKNDKSSTNIELSAEFYERLAKSDFSEIGTTHRIEVQIDGEQTEIEAVDLDKGIISNRQRLIDFFKEAIYEESRNMIDKLGDSPSKDEYQQQSYPLIKFHEIMKCLENTQYCYLQKIT